MTFEEIKQLHEMGFSADQIITLSGSPAPEAEPEKDPEPAPEQDQEQTPEPDPEPVNSEQITSLQNQITEQQKQIKDLIKQLQASNRQNARMDTPPADDLQSQTDAIMAELIRPTIKGSEEK